MLAGGENATKTARSLRQVGVFVVAPIAGSRVAQFQQNSPYTIALAYRITATRKHSRNPNGSKILLSSKLASTAVKPCKRKYIFLICSFCRSARAKATGSFSCCSSIVIVFLAGSFSNRLATADATMISLVVGHPLPFPTRSHVLLNNTECLVVDRVDGRILIARFQRSSSNAIVVPEARRC